MSSRRPSRGQTLVEFALVLPLFVLVVGGIIVFGIGVFYQQQLNNAAREAARYAAIHSATSQCPTTSWLDPAWNRLPPDFDKDVYYDCDPPNLDWPEMSAHARSQVWGLDADAVDFAACWSGYWDDDPVAAYDAPAIGDEGPNEFKGCTIGGIDPRTATSQLGCPAPATSATDDTASNLAFSAATTTNQVTVYACYEWTPPLIGSFVGGSVTMRAVVTEAMQHQR
jgi:Flp pilus assembly protein TadG